MRIARRSCRSIARQFAFYREDPLNGGNGRCRRRSALGIFCRPSLLFNKPTFLITLGLMKVQLFAGLRPLRPKAALRDVIAGVTLASMNIPQVLGYARIAGMPVVTGLYTVLLPVLAFAVFGSSRHLVVAADSATAVIFSGSLSSMAAPASAKYVALVGMVAILTAAILFVAWIFKLGFLADFLAHTVLVGFLTGVGIQVGIAMLGDMLGVAVQSRKTLVQAWEVLQGVGQSNVAIVALSAVVAAGILLGNRIAPRWPFSLFAVVATIAASTAFHFAEHGIPEIGPVAGGLPTIGLPDVTWSEVLVLLPVAGSCFAMIVAQSAATSRAFALRYREEVDEDADILGLSVANAAAAVTGAFVVNGSPTQTAMADRAGARSQVAQLAFAAVVLVVLLFLTGFLQHLPRCVLASIVFTIAVGMIDLKGLREIRRESPGEFYLAAATAAAVVGIGVEQGILLAIALSILRHVRHSYRPHALLLAPDGSGRWVPEHAEPGEETEPGLIVYRFGSDLFFANAKRFVDEVSALIAKAPTPVHWFIVDASAITDVDYSAAESIRQFIGELKRRDIQIVFARVTPYLRSDMDRHRITPAVGEQWIFTTLHEAIAAAQARISATTSTKNSPENKDEEHR
jgi:sulfate permease, SulP family